MKVDWQKLGGLLPAIVQDAGDGTVLMLAYMNEEALNLTLSTGYAHYFSRSKGRIWKKGESSGHVQLVQEAFLDCDNDTLLLKVEQCGGFACHTGSRSCFFKEISLQKCSENVGTPSACDAKNSAMQNFTAVNSTLTNSAAERSEQNLDAVSQNSTLKNSAEKSPYGILDKIYHVCLDRKLNGESALSYVASLYARGENAYLKKIAEEACEFALACKDLSRSELYADIAREGFGEHRADEPRYDVIYEGADLLFHLLLALAAHNIHPDALLDELARRQGQSGIEEKRRREK
ncbi:phosphoribosyl-AMP cyclohydrolase [uncultured Campylobacter sp.]|uniref:phosphoribosyl-AMP cyclohydrolase n=1 Tax=uncultured Campylobacter sp. TaxID=218934 RepID=UPI00262B8426|nr:phosphoribosyl-AMP cyclohydrolase [uncultured Campylobacter sp.]